MGKINYQKIYTTNKDEWKALTREPQKYEALLAGHYSESNHFVYELLQNAEDEKADRVVIEYYDDKLVFYHNGIPFDENDVRGVSSMLMGTKDRNSAQTIGRFGMGFKSVFKYTYQPEIYSDEEAFRIENYLLPVEIQNGWDYRRVMKELEYGLSSAGKYYPFSEQKHLTKIVIPYLKVYNKNNKVRLMIENAAPELLPRELDPDVPDNQILSVALKYKNWEVFIISDDGVFRLAAMAQRIVAMNSEDFINQHKEHYKSLEERIEECNSETNTEITSKDIASNTDPEEASERLADKIAKAVGNIILEPSVQSEEEDDSQELAIDDLPIRELKKYIPDFNEPVFSYLQSNQVKTVGAFRHLTESKVRNMPAKGKQMVYKNTVMRAVKQLDSIIAKIKLK